MYLTAHVTQKCSCSQTGSGLPLGWGGECVPADQNLHSDLSTHKLEGRGGYLGRGTTCLPLRPSLLKNAEVEEENQVE